MKSFLAGFQQNFKRKLDDLKTQMLERIRAMEENIEAQK